VSLRLRVLALVALVAVASVAATAYLAYQQVSRQVRDRGAADQQTQKSVVRALTAYAHGHGTWNGVSDVVHQLTRQTGLQILLTTDTGGVVAGSGTIAAEPLAVDPRPILNLTDRTADPVATTLRLVADYRTGTTLAACLTAHGLEVHAIDGAMGVPGYVTDAASQTDPQQYRACQQGAAAETSDADQERVLACRDRSFRRPLAPTTGLRPDPFQALASCLQDAFAVLTAEVAPPPLHLYLAPSQTGPPLAPGPVAAIALVVIGFALAGTILVTRSALRPVAALTAASDRLGEGDLSRRVPATDGRGELAHLARSFNRMADSLQRGEERQRRMVADVAHELRTPLSNLRGYLEALSDGVLPGDRELFGRLHAEVILQTRILDDLQELALAEAGALTYSRTEVDLGDLLETCRDAHRPAAAQAGVDIVVSAPPGVRAYADPDRIRQVVSNLITNAVRATPAGGTITLAAGADRIRATITVTDTGKGICGDDLPHIFERFWRADTARARSTGGSGLGLAIARQIVADQGGTITADSEPGRGTTMTMTLSTAPQ